MESFAELLEESMTAGPWLDGGVISGLVVAIDRDRALVDVGLKSEGWIPLKEWGDAKIAVGSTVEVYLERFEDKEGRAVLSREKARREEAWIELERCFAGNEMVVGVIFGRVRGGYTVDLNGAVAFLPGSQVDIRPIRDAGALMNSPQPFRILKMDRIRSNMVVSRRAVLEDGREEERDQLLAELREGQIITGIVKNITDYGAFIDIGGIDGLLHVSDIAWQRVIRASDYLKLGESIEVQVLKVNRKLGRISLSRKALEPDPWEGLKAKYPIGTKFPGRVTNVVDYGCFVELEPGIEGLVHSTEMSWTKKTLHPGKIVSTSELVEVMILDLDLEKRRVSLGLKQCQPNPWEAFAEQHPIGSTVEGEIRNLTEFGIFVAIGEVDGMVHISDIDWKRSGEAAMKDYFRSQLVRAKVLDIDVERERIGLGIKQLENDPFDGIETKIQKGAVVTATIITVLDSGLEIELEHDLLGFISRSQLARGHDDRKTNHYSIGQRIDAKVTNIDHRQRRIQLSIKAREIDDDRAAMQQYGGAESGAGLGAILGQALAQRKP